MVIIFHGPNRSGAGAKNV